MTTAISDKTKEECRLCGTVTSVANIRKKLKEKIKGKISFKELIEYFCRVDLIDSIDLPTGVCQSCYQTIVNFCILSVNVEKNQTKYLKQQSESSESHKHKRDDSGSKDSFNDSASTNEDGEKSSSSGKKKQKKNPVVYTKSIEEMKNAEDNNSNCSSGNSSNSRSIGNTSGKFRSESNLKGCFNEVFKLFKDELAENEKSYEKITIKESLLMDGGEIPKTWLSRYSNFVTWKDLKHYCSHCNKNFDSFGALLFHFDESKISMHKRSIKCSSCDSVFNESRCIASYINHMDKNHYNHLKFGCIFCDKIFYNVVRLCEHGIKAHGKLNFKYYPCFDCGLVCPTFDQIAQHKTCHDV